ncbi:hypothetical protein EVAR_89359_1 [Eumeta japonica]|uniref:Uncharacterized protein n=1 Tax=Eumeta variegata TaxID=151549 RepID=A0A4C1Y613_EUMVA|nr:hypothetical protein EVAR_89359_1 [Eumeta japonica]
MRTKAGGRLKAESEVLSRGPPRLTAGRRRDAVKYFSGKSNGRPPVTGAGGPADAMYSERLRIFSTSG